MRLHPPSTILVIVAAALALSIAFQPGDEAKQRAEILRMHEANRLHEALPIDASESCKIVATVLNYKIHDLDWIEKPIVFELGAEPAQNGSLSTSELLQDPMIDQKLKESPLVPLQLKLEALDGERVLDHCPEIGGILDDLENVELGTSGKKPVIFDDGSFSEVFLRMSMPAISDDGNEALIRTSVTSGLLAGGGLEYYLQRNAKGVWYVLYWQGTWIS